MTIIRKASAPGKPPFRGINTEARLRLKQFVAGLKFNTVQADLARRNRDILLGTALFSGLVSPEEIWVGNKYYRYGLTVWNCPLVEERFRQPKTVAQDIVAELNKIMERFDLPYKESFDLACYILLKRHPEQRP